MRLALFLTFLFCASLYAVGRIARKYEKRARLYRLRQEAKSLNPQATGTPEEIERDIMSTYKAWKTQPEPQEKDSLK
jgi:hypothetical protein